MNNAVEAIFRSSQRVLPRLGPFWVHPYNGLHPKWPRRVTHGLDLCFSRSDLVWPGRGMRKMVFSNGVKKERNERTWYNTILMDRKLLIIILIALVFLGLAAFVIRKLLPNNTVNVEFTTPTILSNVNS